MRFTRTRVLATLPVAMLLAACTGMAARTPMAARVGTPAAGGSARTSGKSAAIAAPRAYSAVDVHFMQRMLTHHEQALTMTGLVRTQSSRSAVRILALRMELTQRDEIALMRYWLENRGEPAPAATRADESMPGMLREAQLDSLKSATGQPFDARFLRNMIRHHEGALAMVAEHLRTPDAARQPETSRLISDIEAELRAGLHRLRTLLAELPA